MRKSAALALLATLAACGGEGEAPRPPAVVSLSAQPVVLEAENPAVRVSATVNSSAHAGLTIALEFSGSATRNHDYLASADSIVMPANVLFAGVNIDVFRDFDLEGEETITVSIGEIEGNARAGDASSVTVAVVDGEAADADKNLEEEGDGAVLSPGRYEVNEASVDFEVVVLNFSPPDAGPVVLFAEWSSDPDFATDVNLLGKEEIPGFDPEVPDFDPDLFSFLHPRAFSLPLNRLASNQGYYVRAYLNGAGANGGASAGGDAAEGQNEVRYSFATGADGKVVTRCRSPLAGAAPGGPDPLFAEQWHLRNTGQSGFSGSRGVPGADLRMDGAIGGGLNGAGVKLAVVDTGLEICHPDLAANIEEGKSFNFGFEQAAGSSPTDPFNHDILGDHGTSVAGVAAAVANNGLGGRGVAPGLELRGFNLGTREGEDFDAGLLLSLGGSSSEPDSATAHIFNMSFGSEIPSENSGEDFVRLMQMGTTELRSGRGALYVKAAGNEFDYCGAQHPLNAEIGCEGSNSDPDQNLPYLINVGAFNADDVKSSYSSAGANLWVVAPGGEDGAERPAIITTDQIGPDAGFRSRRADSFPAGHPLNPNGDYMGAFGGTSAAAPATCGAIAILLGVNPELTWRDVKHILASSARRIDPGRAAVRAAFNGKPYIARHAWQTNAAGYHYHNWYGFGAIAIDDAVAMARAHAPDSLGDFAASEWFPASDIAGLPIPDADGAGVTDTLAVAGLPDWANIEAVVVEVAADHPYASDLGIKITSPSGAESIVNAPFNVILDGFDGILDWQLLSNAFYGEAPNGEWTIQVVDLASGDTGSLTSWRLRFYYGDHP